MITMLKSTYEKVKSCVKLSTDMKLSDFWDVTLELKQGEPLSSLLFILSVNDIKSYLDLSKLNATDLNFLSLYMLLLLMI